MRRGVVFAAAVMLTATTPVFAATIVQDLTALSQTFGDLTPFSIVGSAFNPTLGTLTAVTATLTGFYIGRLPSLEARIRQSNTSPPRH